MTRLRAGPAERVRERRPETTCDGESCAGGSGSSRTQPSTAVMKNVGVCALAASFFFQRFQYEKTVDRIYVYPTYTYCDICARTTAMGIKEGSHL